MVLLTVKGLKQKMHDVSNKKEGEAVKCTGGESFYKTSGLTFIVGESFLLSMSSTTEKKLRKVEGHIH